MDQSELLKSMVTSSAKIDLLLNSIEENCDAVQCRDLLVPYMIACASLIEHRMPAVAAAGFGVSKDYAAGRGSMESVRKSIQECWVDLRKNHQEIQLDQPEVSAIRSVICILQRQLETDSDDFLNLTSFFLQLVNNVESQQGQEEELLRTHFASCLRRED